jgi:hypothetical protein
MRVKIKDQGEEQAYKMPNMSLYSRSRLIGICNFILEIIARYHLR